MKALAFAACISLLTIIVAAAQQSPPLKPEVIGVTGSTIILPRQAGSKDAPDISLVTHGFKLQSDHSESLTIPQSSPTKPKGTQGTSRRGHKRGD
jgi:hypothetical protein